MSIKSTSSNLDHVQAIDDMLVMQNTLNEMTNGSEWRSGMTQKGKRIDWQRCIYMETAELIDSYPWKHWKAIDAAIDIENARVELVDIWHFLLSLALENHSYELARNELVQALENARTELESKHSEIDIIEQVNIYEKLMREALKKSKTIAGLGRLADAFFQSCHVAELDFAKLYETYMAKNVLNKFRQDHGYKEGLYIKDWDGKEDNVVMLEIIASLNTFNTSTLYQALQEKYPKGKS